MPNPGITPTEQQNRFRVLYECLEDGFFPPSQRRREGQPAIAEAARRLGMPNQTLRSWIARMTEMEQAPDWGRWKDPRTIIDREPIKVKPVIRMRAASPSGKPIRVVVPGDMHDCPELPKDRFEWIGNYVAQSNPDFFVDIGDSISFESLCSHIGNETFNGRLKGTYEQDLRSADEAYEKLYEHFPESTKRLKCCGNHEDRLFKFEDQNPEIMGMMQGEYRRLLEKHKIDERPFGEFHFVGGVGFVHVPLNTMGKPFGGESPCKTIANKATFDIVFGHTHRLGEERPAKIGPQNHVTILNIGCALPSQHIEKYAKGSTTGWWWGLHDLEIQGGQIQSVKQVSMHELEREFG